MSSTSKPIARAHYNLPAGLVLTPRDLKQYRRWQSLYTTLKPTECGFIPTAIEYEDFQQWLKKQDSGYFSDVFDDIYEHIQTSTFHTESTVASLCQHTMHPVATGQLHLRCPVCTIEIHLNYMKMLTRKLDSANGRPLPSTGTPSDQQENLYLAWSQGKISTLRQVCELEEMSAKEEEWTEKHPNFQYENIQSATKALELYWSETAECRSTKQYSTKNKRTTFTEDTNFLPGRPIDYFLRRSPRYEPGKYAVTEELCEEDEDVSEDSEDYSCARIHVVGGPENSHGLDNLDTPEEQVQAKNSPESLEDDDGDSDWEDIDSEEEESCDGSYVCFEEEEEEEEEASFIVFAND
jgi:hypothetical protein